jgi:hypothetical protein
MSFAIPTTCQKTGKTVKKIVNHDKSHNKLRHLQVRV